MNIFVLDECPVKSAQMQCDKHVVKMVLESAQMLSTAHRLLDGVAYKAPSKTGKTVMKFWKLPDDREGLLYKAVHTGHPCSVWTMKNANNYEWHYIHFKALSDEYTYRYGKNHKSWEDLGEILKNSPNNIPKGKITQHALAMGAAPECIDPDDIVGSYRAFYQTKLARFRMSWTRRNPPTWFRNLEKND